MASTVSKKINLSPRLLEIMRTIVKGGDSTSLIARGYTYSQIAEYLSILTVSGIVKEENGKPVLTDAGKKALEISARKTRNFWLQPLENRRVAKDPLSEPYFPGHRSLIRIIDRSSS